LFPHSYTILFWEFYFLQFSLHAKNNAIYVTYFPVLVVFLKQLHKLTDAAMTVHRSANKVSLLLSDFQILIKI
jgi:hypothetical protein